MDASNDSAPIIKKVKKVHGGHHGGAWKVAYADFVTAMMALFIVLWILSQNEEIKQSVAGYFKDPIGFSTKSNNIIEGKNSGPSIDLKLQEEMKMREIEKSEFEKMGEKLKRELASDTELLGLSSQVKIEIVNEGLRIELIDSDKGVFFALGTSELNKTAQKLIEKIGKEIAKLPNKIIVEGHTDSHQYLNKGTGFTNFELSAERALAAKRALVVGGLLEKQIDEIHGYADTRLRNPKDPFSFVNRRISFTVKFNR